jgi:undecaprenyl-diphosphatase
MLWASRLGDGWLWIITGLALLAAGSSRSFRTLAAVAVAMGIANSALVILKRRFRRPRPWDQRRAVSFDVRPLRLFAEDCFSFPSGHTMNAFAVGTVVVLSFPSLLLPVLVVAVSVAASRVVLGLHYPSDVLAGVLLGFLIGASVHAAVFP